MCEQCQASNQLDKSPERLIDCHFSQIDTGRIAPVYGMEAQSFYEESRKAFDTGDIQRAQVFLHILAAGGIRASFSHEDIDGFMCSQPLKDLFKCYPH